MTQLAPKTSENGPIQGVQLREVTEADLPTFFEQQQDSAANQMAAFTAKDPASQARVSASPLNAGASLHAIDIAARWPGMWMSLATGLQPASLTKPWGDTPRWSMTPRLNARSGFATRVLLETWFLMAAG